ncbi:T9SS type A sorting domain-containing protein [Chryseobacterium gwangjuense]|uniref:T9SS type A sorting domain-containing protein n=1 Tax=Chryseobacterium gwangjuense TaxID=1069980 RepID=UPI001E2864BE|nr:T9SS type A sorting domain-containing protein [Chryseobacterium gwangjuense]MCE3077209.1 T9SS type A sorting domain-containing protein [Chryseobacterium gwangjuense]
MRYKFIFSLLFIYFSNTLSSQTPSIQWQKSYGGIGFDQAYDVEQTSDGGYITVGYTSSPPSGDVTLSKGGNDVWVIKTNATGGILWQKTIGGQGYDMAKAVKQTTEGGYIIAGITNSTDGDVSVNKGTTDVWVVKLDSKGDILWEKSYGGSGGDDASSIFQTLDGGYIVAGQSYSTDGDITGHHGTLNHDAWIIKIDAAGNLQWEKSFGGTSQEFALSVKPTSDGNFIIAGGSSSPNGNITSVFGGEDCWLIKIDILGNIIWQKSYGGSAHEYFVEAQQTFDGGYIAIATTQSYGGNISGQHGLSDYWAVKFDAAGNIQWQKCLGGSDTDTATSIFQDYDGGYIVAGFTYSNNGDLSTHIGLADYWVIKLNPSGNIMWEKTFGGTLNDWARKIKPTSDGGLIVTGASKSNDGDVSGNHGDHDVWLVKLSSSKTTLNTHENNSKNNISIYPNPAKDFVTIDHLPNEATISIHDMSGRKIFSKKHAETKVSMNTSQLTSGTYIIQINDKEKIILSEKLIIKK